MSDDAKRCYAHPEDYVWGSDVHRACWTPFVPASAFDAVVAERDAARADQVNERDRLSFERDQARAALARATADLDAMTTAALVAESRIRALEEAGDALAAAALGADRQVAAWRAVRNREVAA